MCVCGSIKVGDMLMEHIKQIGDIQGRLPFPPRLLQCERHEGSGAVPDGQVHAPPGPGSHYRETPAPHERSVPRRSPCSTLVLPSVDLAIDSSIRAVVSRAACTGRCARFRTSSATTAKPSLLHRRGPLPLPHSTPECWSETRFRRSPSRTFDFSVRLEGVRQRPGRPSRARQLA